MKVSITIGLVVMAVLALTACLPAQRVGDRAPSWSGTLSTGKKTSGAELLRNGPYILYFIKDACPVNEPLVRFYREIANAYPNVQFLGVFNGDAKAFTTWNREHDVKFPVVLDPNLRVIRAFRAQASPWVVAVNRNGTFARVDPGSSQERLRALNEFAARTAKVPIRRIDFSRAPTRDTFG